MRTRLSWVPRTLALAAVAACGGDTPTGPPPQPVPTQLSVATQPGASVVNGSLLTPQPVVRLRDAAGLPVAKSGVTVSAALVESGAVLGGTATVVTDNSGLAVFSGLTLTGTVGPYTLRFAATGLASADANAIALAPGAPVALSVATQPSVTATAGSALAQQPQVQLRDQSGNHAPVANVTVTASLVAGTATLGNATAVTNGAGVATFAGLAIAGPVGSYTLRFTAPGLTSADAAAATVLAAGAPAQLAVVAQPPASLTNGATLATAPEVELRDAFGNPSPRAGVAVAVSILSGAGTLSGPTTVTTDAAGRAAFPGLAITGTAGNFTLRFTSGTLAPAVSNAIVLGPGAASRLRITTAPPGVATNGTPLTTQPVVQVQDSSGNAVAHAGIVVTAGTVPGGPVVTNGTATTDVSGRATFAGLTLTGTSAGYFFTFAAPGLTPDTAFAPTFLQAGAPTQLVIVQQPSASATNGTALAVQPVVRLQDASGNNTPTANVVVTATLVSGTATLTSATATTQATGIAAFAGLTITGTAGPYTLRFSAPGAASVDAAAPTTLNPGAAKHLTLTVQPPVGAASGTALAPQPVVQLRDTSGNAVAQAGVTVTATVIGGGVTLANAVTMTNASGAATFSGLTLTGPVGTYTLRFSAAGLTDVDAATTLALAAGAPTAIVLVTPPPASAVNGVPLGAPPVVEVRDAVGNPVPSVGVTVTAAGSVVLTAASATTAASGQATFSGLTLTGAVAGYNLRFCVGACAGATIEVSAAQPTALQAGPPAAVSLLTAPSASAQSGVVLATQPVALVLDQSGNPVGGTGVTLTAGAASVANGSATTGAAGVAAFAGVAVSGAPGSYTFQFAAGSAAAAAPLALAAGPPASLTLTQAPSATAASGIVLAQQPVVLLRDATGNPLAGLTVTATSGTATVLNGTAVTNASGIASFTALGLAGTSASHSLTFAAGAASTGAAVTLTAGPAASMTLDQQPAVNAVNGAPLATQPAVSVRDASNNGVPGAVVTASLTTGGATLANATATTDANGVATFSGLSLFGLVGSYTLRFTVPGLAPVDAVATTSLAAGPAAALALATAPSASAPNDVALAVQPVLQVVDAGGNAVSAAGTQVTASLTVGAAALAGSAAVTNGSGVATFGTLKATGTAGAYTLRFAAPGLDSIEAPFTLLPGAATGLELVAQPSFSTPADVVLAQTPVVRLRDVSGNTVPQAGVNVTVSSSDAAAVFLGTVTVTTSAAGLASFSDLGISGPRGRHLLRFDGGALATVEAADSTVVAKPLALAVPVSDSAHFDEERPYVVEVLPGDTLLTVHITGGQGTADLVVRYGAAPDIENGRWDCYPRLAGSEETCTFRNPAPGFWYVTLLAFPFSFADVTLLVNSYP